jgi:triosephosphate isomerase (TIM)
MKPLIVANWKCNPVTLKKAKTLFDSVGKGIKNIKNTETVVCPPFVYLSELKKMKGGRSKIKLGGQDVFWENTGAYTGEISPEMLKDSGAQYVIIGHSERRKYQKETDEAINKKLKAALSAGLKAILCIDNLSQIKKDLNGLTGNLLLNLVIAYEPIFAIGTGKACSVERAEKMRMSIKEKLSKKNIPVLYGGSVNSQNAASYLKKGGFQGLLIGGASLKIEEFSEIIRRVDR